MANSSTRSTPVHCSARSSPQSIPVNSLLQLTAQSTSIQFTVHSPLQATFHSSVLWSKVHSGPWYFPVHEPVCRLLHFKVNCSPLLCTFHTPLLSMDWVHGTLWPTLIQSGLFWYSALHGPLNDALQSIVNWDPWPTVHVPVQYMIYFFILSTPANGPLQYMLNSSPKWIL